MRNISEQRLHELIRIGIDVAGSQKAFAEQVGVSPQYLCDVLRGHRDVGTAKAILRWFGLERVVSYRRIDGGKL